MIPRDDRTWAIFVELDSNYRYIYIFNCLCNEKVYSHHIRPVCCSILSLVEKTSLIHDEGPLYAVRFDTPSHYD